MCIRERVKGKLVDDVEVVVVRTQLPVFYTKGLA